MGGILDWRGSGGFEKSNKGRKRDAGKRIDEVQHDEVSDGMKEIEEEEWWEEFCSGEDEDDDSESY